MLRLADTQTAEIIFVVSVTVFTSYVFFLILTFRGERAFIFSPPVMALAKMFMLGYGITIFYIYDTSLYNDFLTTPDSFDYLNNTVIMASVAVIVFYFSYKSKIITKTASTIINFITVRHRILSTSSSISINKVILLYSISFFSKLYLISIGAFGVLSTLFQDSALNPFFYTLSMLSSLGTYALLILFIHYHKTKKNIILLILLVMIELALAILSGFKGPIVMIAVFYMVSYMVVSNKRIELKYYFYILITLILAYAIVEPYRFYLLEKGRNQSQMSGFNSVFNDVIESSKYSRYQSEQSTGMATLRRLNYFPEMVKFQEYSDRFGISENDPDFVNHIITIPLQIFIPRILWPEKPKSNLGLVFVTAKVYGSNYITSTAFGPLGFLYVTGGTVAIGIGFFFIAFLIKLLGLMYSGNNVGGWIVSMIMFQYTSIESQLDFYVVGFFHTLFVGLLLQKFAINNHRK